MAIVRGYHHIHIVSPDPERAAAWFERFFGARIAGREEARGARNVVLRIGEATLSVRTPRPDDPIGETGGLRPYGLDHICFLVDDIEVMVRDMEENGVEIAERIFAQPGGADAAFVRGPEGVLFELIQAGQP